MPDSRRVDLGGYSFRIDEQAELPFRQAFESKMVPRRDITGDIGKENLNTTEWPWAISRFEGGEGRLVFDSEDAEPPHFHSTGGAIDTRVSGQFRMAPIMRLRTAAEGTTTTETAGKNLTKLTGGEVVKNESLQLNAVGEGGRQNKVPGAVEVTVSVDFLHINATKNTILAVTPSIEFQIRVIQSPGGAATVVASEVGTFAWAGGTVSGGSFTVEASFTALAATTYQYEAKILSVNFANLDEARLRRISETTGAAPVDDPRLLQTGYADKVWLVDDDGTNSDVFTYDLTNNHWDLVHANLNTADPVGAANSDQFQYIGFTNNLIYRGTDVLSSFVQYTSDPSAGSLVGVAVGNDRLYGLYTGALYEYTLDQTTGLPRAGTKRAGSDVFPTVANANTNSRQQITGIDNGVRWFVNMRGEQAGIYEFSDGAARQIAMLPRGYMATAIYHYMGVTWIGAHYIVNAADPAKKRAAIYYIDQLGNLQFLEYLRFHNPDPEQVRFITAHGHDMYFLQGNNVWRYDGRYGGIVLDRRTSTSDSTAARGMAVQDTKLWACYQGVGAFVSEDAYPTDETVWLYSPVWDYDVPHHDKTFLSFEVVSDPLPAGTEIEMQYQLDNSGTWVSAGISSTLGTKTHTFNLFGSASVPATVKGRYIQWRVGLSSTDGADTPIVRSVALKAYVLEYEQYFDLTVLTEDEDSIHRGPKQLTGPRLADNLKTLVDNKQVVSFVDRYSDPIPGSKDTYAVIIEDPHQDLSRPGQGSVRLRLKILA